MGSEIDYDSTDAASTPPDALKGVAKLVGLAFEMRMRPTGEITELEGMDEALAKLFESDAPDVGAMRQMMSEMLSEETMKRSLEAAVLPSHALKEGEEWKRAIAIPLGPLGKLDAAYVYRYEGLATAPAPRTAKIGLEFTMKAATGQPDFSAIPGSELLDIALDIGDSTGKGTLEFDVDAGRLARSSVETEIELTMEMKLKEAPEGADMPPMEMHIEMAMRNDMRLLGPDEPAFEPRPKSGK